MAGREELLAEVSGFLAWCERLDKPLFELAHDTVRRQRRAKARHPAVQEVGSSRMQMTFISALDKAMVSPARHFDELADEVTVAGAVRLAATVAAQAVRQRERWDC